MFLRARRPCDINKHKHATPSSWMQLLDESRSEGCEKSYRCAGPSWCNVNLMLVPTLEKVDSGEVSSSTLQCRYRYLLAPCKVTRVWMLSIPVPYLRKRPQP